MNPLTVLKIVKIGGPIMLIVLVAMSAYHVATVSSLNGEIAVAKEQTADVRDRFQKYREGVNDAQAKKLRTHAVALQQAQLDFDRQLQHERELSSEAHRIAAEHATQAAIADQEIERLKNENEIVREWAATAIPAEWIDWLHDDDDVDTDSLSAERSDRSTGNQVATASGGVDSSDTDCDGGTWCRQRRPGAGV